MIYVTIFSKQGLDIIMFHPEYQSDIELVLSLEGKRIQNLELRDNIIIGELKAEVD